MRKFIQILVLSMLTILPANAADPINDTLIIPGERVGPVTKNTTEEDLKKLLPEGQVKRTLASYIDAYVCATWIFPGSDKEAVIIWDDSKPYPAGREEEASESQKICDEQPLMKNILEVQIWGKAWRTAEGIGIGSTIADLEKANGANVSFSTAESEGNGGVSDWHGGKYDDQSFEHFHVNPVRIVLDYFYGENAQELWSEDEQDKLKQGNMDSGTIPDDKKQHITIGVFELTFPDKL